MSPLRLDCNHLDLVEEVVSASCESRWGRNDFAYFLAHPYNASRGLALPTAEGPRLVCFAVALLDGGLLDLAYIATHPRARQSGHATRLLGAYRAEPDIGRIRLEVAEGNLPALALYSRLGFREIGRKRAYYERRYDALILEWERVSQVRTPPGPKESNRLPESPSCS